MADIKNILQKPRSSVGNNISGKDIVKRFGNPQDNVELHISDAGGNIVHSDENFTEYLQGELDVHSNLFSEFNVDPVTLLRNKGFTTGKYNVLFKIICVNSSKLFSMVEYNG